MDYLALPFILKEGYLGRCNLEESITYSIGLLLSTRPGTIPFSPEYGCNIWDKEFSDLQTANKTDIRGGLRNSIDKFEKRLYNVSISFLPMDDGSLHTLGLAVKVTGNYRDGNEEMKYEATFHLG